MPGTKTVTVNIPGRSTPVTVQNVPTDLSEEDFKTQFRQRHPEYFSTATPTGMFPSPAASLSSAATNLSDRISSSPIVQGAEEYLKRGWDIAKGTAQTFDPRQAMSAMFHGDIPGAIAQTPAYRMAHGIVGAEKQLGPQLAEDVKTAYRDPNILTIGKAATTAGTMLDPLAQPAVTNIYKMQQEGQPLSKQVGAGAADITALAAGEKAPGAARTTAQLVKGGLEPAAHASLGRAATEALGEIGQGGRVHQAISQRFGQLVNDVVTRDLQDGSKISMKPVWEKVMEYADDYGQGKTTPNFNAIVDAIQNRPMDLTFKEAHDLLKEIDARWQKVEGKGTPDAAAATSARQDISNLLDQRASDLGRTPQWQAAKSMWRTLKEYQGEGVLNKLINSTIDPAVSGGITEGGKRFFDVLRDPENQAKLQEIGRAFENFGLPKKFFQSLGEKYAPLHDFLQTIAMGSKLKLLMKHPITAGIGVAGGTVAGGALGHPIVGASIGAMKGARMGAELPAARFFGEEGRVPEVTPLAKEAAVKPVGTGEKPIVPRGTPSKTPAVDPKIKLAQDVASALQNQGYKRTMALHMAQKGVEEAPESFDSAFRAAMKKEGPAAAKEPPKITVPPSRELIRSGPKTAAQPPGPKTQALVSELSKAERVKMAREKKK